MPSRPTRSCQAPSLPSEHAITTSRAADRAVDGASAASRRFTLRLGLGLGLVTALALALGGALSACGKKPAAPTAPGVAASAAEPAPAGRVYTVGTDAVYAPFESENEKGEIVGFDAELIQAAAAKAGIEVEIINTPWEGLMTALEQGDLDAAISAITITEERRQSLDFSAPYFEAQQLIVVPTASKVQRFSDLKSVRVAVQNGAAGDELAARLFSKNSQALQRFESIPLALAELEAGKVDAVLADNGVLSHYVAHNGSNLYRLVNDAAFEHEQYGMAVKKGNAELLGKLNEGLAALRADGSYATLYQRYFGEPLPPASK